MGQDAEHTGAIIHPEVQWARVARHESDSVLLPGGRSAGPPRVGWLDPDVLAAVMVLPAAWTFTPEDLTAAVWNGWGVRSSDPEADPEILTVLSRGPFHPTEGRLPPGVGYIRRTGPSPPAGIP